MKIKYTGCYISIIVFSFSQSPPRNPGLCFVLSSHDLAPARSPSGAAQPGARWMPAARSAGPMSAADTEMAARPHLLHGTGQANQASAIPATPAVAPAP